jgi:hypothetical protein
MFYKKNEKQQDPLILSGDEEDDGLIVENTGKTDDKLLSEDEINLKNEKHQSKGPTTTKKGAE